MIDTTAPAGTAVRIAEDDGSVTHTKTRSLPWQLGHGAWVVLVEGRAGGYSCERMSVDKEQSDD